MACEHDYEIKLVEPNTKWKNRIGELAQKNTHNVPYDKIKAMSLEFEHNIDLNKIINEFKTDAIKDSSSAPILPQQQQKASISKNNKPKSSGLLFGANESFQTFLQISGSEWYIPQDLSSSSSSSSSSTNMTSPLNFLSETICPPQVSTKQVQTSVELSFTDSYLVTRPRDIQHTGNCQPNVVVRQNNKTVKYDRSCDTLDLAESLLDGGMVENINALNDLFGDAYAKSFYAELLQKYDNDLNIVANLLSETLDFNEVLTVSQQQSVIKRNPSRLGDLCSQLLDNMNTVLEQHYNVVDDTEQLSESDESFEEVDEHRQTFDGEKKFEFKLDKNFARILFDQFSDPNDVFEESFNVDCDLNLAFEIFRNWKKTRLKKKFIVEDEEDIEIINEKINQIETDARLALELFEHENMCHPVDGYPISLSDYGVNSASISLRQIMAEQKAEQFVMNKKMQHKNTVCRYSDNPTLAIRLKRRQVHELYLMKIDEKLLDEVFFKNK
jgi:hypothetical protein